MATLVYIRDAQNSRLLHLGIDEEGETSRYTISSTLYSALGAPPRFSELDSDTLDRIKYADEHYRAEKKALSLLSFADNNEKSLYMKLLRAGFCREIAEQVCREMVSLGYIDEGRQLERIILSEANGKLRGPMKIIPYAVAKGYSLADARDVLSRLIERGEIDLEKNARLLARKKLPAGASHEERKKLLYKNGYKIC